MSIRSTIMAVAAFFATANAHIIMEQPVPYSVEKIDNGPINKSQFPCKSNLGFTVSEMNKMAVGQQQTIKFKGTAVHGGGSCQLSVTMDTEPTENSKFKVIKSIEGGCPGVDGQVSEYNYELPASMPNGKATFAWTWTSKMSGAPELYMNCAPIEVTGGSDDKTAFEALPDMLVMNLDDSCESMPNFAVQFPNPGSVVQKGATNDLKPPVGNACGSSGSTPAEPSSPAGEEPSAAPTSANDGQYSPAPAPTAPAAGQPSATPTSVAGGEPTASPSNGGSGGGVFAPGASGAASVTSPAAPPVPSTSTTLVTVTASPTAPSPVASTVPVGTGSPTAPSMPSAGGSGTCSEDGAVVCNGADQFGLCDKGKVVWQAVAAGTTCVNGNITKRGYNGRIARPRWTSRRIVS